MNRFHRRASLPHVVKLQPPMASSVYLSHKAIRCGTLEAGCAPKNAAKPVVAGDDVWLSHTTSIGQHNPFRAVTSMPDLVLPRRICRKNRVNAKVMNVPKTANP